MWPTDFLFSILGLGPPLLQYNGYRGSFPVVKRLMREVDFPLYLAPRFRKGRSIHFLPTSVFMKCCRVTFTLFLHFCHVSTKWRQSRHCSLENFYILCHNETQILLYVMHQVAKWKHNIFRIYFSRCTLFLCVFILSDQWCQWELEMANHRLFEGSHDFLILLELERLDPTTLPQHLRYLMVTRTYLEWPQNGTDTSTAWRRLKTRLGTSKYQKDKEKEVQS